MNADVPSAREYAEALENAIRDGWSGASMSREQMVDLYTRSFQKCIKAHRREALEEAIDRARSWCAWQELDESTGETLEESLIEALQSLLEGEDIDATEEREDD